MSVKRTDNIPHLIENLSRIIYIAASKGGFHLQRSLKVKIRDGDPSWTALADSTIAAKGSSQAWVDTGELRGEITLNVIEGLPTVCHVGIFNHMKGTIATYLEYGTDVIPERPLFRTVWLEEKDATTVIVRQSLREGLEKVLGM